MPRPIRHAPGAHAPPDPARETPALAPSLLRDDVARALVERHGERLPDGHGIDVVLSVGERAASIACVIGTERRAHEIALLARGDGDLLDGPLGLLVDWLDDILSRIAGVDDAFLPLDWQGRDVDGVVVFVRGEVRDYVAEEEAARLLGEAPPARLIAPRVND